MLLCFRNVQKNRKFIHNNNNNMQKYCEEEGFKSPVYETKKDL